jgi:hypothetical protein
MKLWRALTIAGKVLLVLFMIAVILFHFGFWWLPKGWRPEEWLSKG